MEMREQIGVNGQQAEQPEEAPRIAEANILNVSDAGRLSTYEMLFNTNGHEMSDNRMFGGRHHGENDENTEEGKERKSDTLRKMSDAMGLTKPWYELPQPTSGGFLGDVQNRLQNTMSDIQRDPLAAASNIGESALHNMTFGLFGRSAEQIEQDIRTTQRIDGSTPRSSGADRLVSDIGKDVGGTALNVGESALNLVTFGLVGRSREQIAEQQAVTGSVRGEVAATATPDQPTTTREDLIAQASTHDVVNQPRAAAPDLGQQFASAVDNVLKGIDLNPFDNQPVLNRQLAAASPAPAA